MSQHDPNSALVSNTASTSPSKPPCTSGKPGAPCPAGLNGMRHCTLSTPACHWASALPLYPRRLLHRSR